MTVYVGDHGYVTLRRASNSPINAVLQPGDINAEKRRFSFQDDVRGELITGDQVDILRTDGGNVDFIVGHDFTDWRGYIFVDIMGGIRLYDNYEGAIRGEIFDAVELVDIASNIPIRVETRDTDFKFLAQVKGFEFTTERETVDTTHLSDQFRKRYEAGLISGQGRLDCFWDHKSELCDPYQCAGAKEMPLYLAQLCIRLTQGADFSGRFFIYRGTDTVGTDPRASVNSVWYESECIVTNCSVNVTAGDVIETTIDFVTTGIIRLLVGIPPSLILLDSEPALLLTEDGSGIILQGAD